MRDNNKFKFRKEHCESIFLREGLENKSTQHFRANRFIGMRAGDEADCFGAVAKNGCDYRTALLAAAELLKICDF